MLRKSLAEYGDLGAIVFNRKSKQLVGGHQRVKLLSADAKVTITRKFEKPTRVGTVAEGFVTFDDDGERFKYREVSWSKQKEMAANIAANKGAGDWDHALLTDWMKELEAFDPAFDMDLTMFSDAERGELPGTTVKEHTRTGPTGVDEDEVPEKAPARTKLGDIYVLGRHRLMCGDSTDVKAVERLMAGERAQMIYTDPPYGMKLDTDFSWAGGPNSGNHSKGAFGGKYRSIQGDHADFKPELIQAILAVPCKETFIWGADYFAEHLSDRNEGSWVVWDKCTRKDGEVAGENMIGSNFELCWSRQRHKRELARFMHKGLASCENDKRQHPTQKPVALAEWFLNKWGNSEDRVLDLFGGSGSTLIACEKTDRKCFMMEIDPSYCDVIVERWENFTGEKAKRVEHGKSRVKSASRSA